MEILSNLMVEPTLISRIKEAQQEDSELWANFPQAQENVSSEFMIDNDHVLWFRDRLCVPNNSELKDQMLTEAHKSMFYVHPGTTKMYRNLQNHYWWVGMKRDIADFVSRCLTGQQVKSKHQRPGNLLQSLNIPVRKWEHDMLRACVLEWHGSWDSYLYLIEFSYNNSWQSSFGMASYEALYGQKCRTPTCWNEVGKLILEGPELVQVTTEKVEIARQMMKEAQARQKSYADKRRRPIEFQPGDKVFLKVSPTRGIRRFGLKGKLSPTYINPFGILEGVGVVSYRLTLPPQLSHVQNVFMSLHSEGETIIPYTSLNIPWNT
ncbi:hypothetical protein L6452_05807 [Arctium lappa]|uniref:Uncharacterized protein n=1 Tax=Arctium lappa TaxID=4217 RepID=A0ACB9EI38_ARCLA|nr:hypothetical protein L6452_05807 [Arctium lappa]